MTALCLCVYIFGGEQLQQVGSNCYGLIPASGVVGFVNGDTLVALLSSTGQILQLSYIPTIMHALAGKLASVAL